MTEQEAWDLLLVSVVDALNSRNSARLACESAELAAEKADLAAHDANRARKSARLARSAAESIYKDAKKELET